MDKEQLISNLHAFRERCMVLGKPLDEICLIEAFPGDSSSSFTLQVKAKWAEENSCYNILDFLFDVLFKTTDLETRRNIFYIQVLDSADKVHCFQESHVSEHKSSQTLA